MSYEGQNIESKPYYFSIIVPAHNEEKYIGETLECVRKLDYPKDYFEALVVENGSSDRTYELAKQFDDKNIRTMSISLKGVSRAKNFALGVIRASSDWIIYLDADTHLKPSFLTDLSAFLRKNEKRNFAIGTTAVEPIENKKWYALLWFHLYNWGHKNTNTSYSIQIARASLRNKARFDETITLAEDLKYIKELLPFGNFFYFDTDAVSTSTRRFDAIGWNLQFIKWNFHALMFSLFKKAPQYPVIR
ncbi:MAG: glycosyltransferase [Candidatus Paceibacterota bacterium]|jgi:glycosyltransferase involved in cell wall biosynthesis|nr:glycosyltransferase [Candidatus Paceibacterota bacterium]